MNDGNSRLSRRGFLGRVGVAAAAIGGPGIWTPASADDSKRGPMSLCAELHGKIARERLELINYPQWHDIRKQVLPGWECSTVRVGKLGKVQQSLVEEILRAATSDDGYKRIVQQMKDDSAGLKDYALAFCGKPGEKAFMFMLTGRHLTLKVDGNHADKLAFGGPVMYGHGEWLKDHTKNVYYSHVQQANAVYAALDGAQRAKALGKHPPHELALDLRRSGFWGLKVGSMSADQQALVKGLLRHVSSMWEENQVGELERIVRSNGGIGALHIAFYSQGDLGGDKLWDVWRLEGPGFVWHFRGYPHVHAYINAKALPKKR